MPLDQIIKIESKLINYAYNLCGDKCTAKDLVQEMYIKLLSCNKEVIKPSYAFITLRNIAYNKYRVSKAKRENTVRLDYIQDIAYNESISNDFDDLDIFVLKEVEKLPTRQKEILKSNTDNSLRSVAKQFDTYHLDIYREINKAKETILNTKVK